ncbi:DinB family protein [Sphingobacterium spiritivorum ATCC 33300]|uniref:DinB family protein n=1 Tax=Sphingobacterium spiritivorum ATCC 33300 TaxID=525372 RepID=C2FY64_SPHSI|nr:DinB family protein [Sphingobacterium spiritivorum]EEI92117.1 DinB family protein [Sphingobacterium spiritivorum ATCC 33300]QQS96624.1 damage-inducible protein DinB [Sphingobacterium spiritivorum]
MKTNEIISKAELLKHWQGHRSLTRRVIEAFPEKDLFEFKVGPMRPFSLMAQELISIAGPGLKGIVNRVEEPYSEKIDLKTKQEILDEWDKVTKDVDMYFDKIKEEDFHETFNLFGEYKSPVYENLLYFIDNEIHHRGQGYVYLRALGIQPPPFWERY